MTKHSLSRWAQIETGINTVTSLLHIGGSCKTEATLYEGVPVCPFVGFLMLKGKRGKKTIRVDTG